jgi:hypothetical protein
VLQIVIGRATVKHVTDYYRSESNYAGATFSQLNPNDPFSIGGGDLLAARLLSVDNGHVAVRLSTP